MKGQEHRAARVSTHVGRTAARRRASGEPEPAEADRALAVSRRILERPVSAALVVAFTVATWVLPRAPGFASEVEGLVLLVPVLRLLPSELWGEMRPALLLLAIAFTVGTLRQVFSALPTVERFLILPHPEVATFFQRKASDQLRLAVLVIGLTPMCPMIVVEPTVEIPDLARIVKLAALPRFTGTCAAGAVAVHANPPASAETGLMASRPAVLEAVMDRALPRVARIAIAVTRENRVAGFMIRVPLESCALVQRATAAIGRKK
jgi:mRNA-degrading endonuclease toxin of MazEF toxin-antitoxin module